MSKDNVDTAHRTDQGKAVVKIEGLRKTYGKTVAVDNISLEVYEGEIFGMVGPNGAGKTTTIECVEGLRQPDKGNIEVLGLDPKEDSHSLRERVGVQLQTSALQDRIKVWGSARSLRFFLSQVFRLGIAARNVGIGGQAKRLFRQTLWRTKATRLCCIGFGK